MQSINKMVSTHFLEIYPTKSLTNHIMLEWMAFYLKSCDNSLFIFVPKMIENYTPLGKFEITLGWFKENEIWDLRVSYTRGPTPVRDLYGKLKRLDSQQPTFFKQRVNFCQFSCFQMVLLKTYKSFLKWKI